MSLDGSAGAEFVESQNAIGIAQDVGIARVGDLSIRTR